MNWSHWNVKITLYDADGEVRKVIRTTASKARTVEQVAAWARKKFAPADGRVEVEVS